VAAPVDAQSGEVHRRTLGAVFGATFFVRFAFGITLAVFASYILGHSTGLSGGDVEVVGLVSAMAPVGEFSTVLLSGIVADRVGRFPVLFGGMAGAAVLFGVVATTRNTIALGAVNFLFGISSGAILAASLAVVADRSGAYERGFEMGRFDAMNLFGWLGGFAFGIAFLGWLPNRSLGVVFVLGAVALIAGLVVAAYLVRGIARVHPAAGEPIGSILGGAFRRGVLLVTLPWLVIYMLIGAVLVFIGTSAKSVGIPLDDIAAGIAAGGAVLVASQPWLGKLADRHGRMRMMTVGTVGFVGVMASASYLIAYGVNYVAIGTLAVSALGALAYGPAALAALADLSRAVSRATTMAIYSLTISLGMLLGIVAFSQLVGALGNDGYYVFFGGVSAGLVVLTLARYLDVRTPVAAAAPTTPVR
jgi:MFS family permease